MKQKYTAIGFCLLLIAIFAFRTGAEPQDLIQARFQERINAFSRAAAAMQIIAARYKPGKAYAAELKAAYIELRVRYKAAEYLWTYSDPAFVDAYINGAPLPELEENSFGPLILEPVGLQVIDEQMGEAVSDSNTAEISTLLKTMQTQLQASSLKTIHNATVFSAARSGLLRLYTMGLTGFDLPAGDRAIADALVVLQTMHDDLSLFRPAIAVRRPGLADSLFTSLEGSMQFLKRHNDFDKLDRFTLLQRYIDPVYARLLQVQLSLGYELPHESSLRKQAVNDLSKSLFDPALLNPAFYISIPASAINPASVSLGEMLFFDPILSADMQRACASCHDPAKAFTDGVPKSVANGRTGTVARNAPGLLNSVYSERYFHDLRAEDLSDQMEHVVTSPLEFNSTWDEIVAKLKQSATYRLQFAEAFKTPPEQAVNAGNLRFAMAAFVGSLNSFNSPFDRLIRGEQTSGIANSPGIIRGYNLFMGKAACGTCHFAPVFNGTVPPFYANSESEVLGVPEDPYSKKPQLGSDKGRAEALLREQVDFNAYAFKTPGLRNIAETGPYMHNGAYKDLQKVMEFYNLGGGAGIGIHLPHQTLAADKLNLSKREIADIILFMQALSDNPYSRMQPPVLPAFESHPEWNSRKSGGTY